VHLDFGAREIGAVVFALPKRAYTLAVASRWATFSESVGRNVGKNFSRFKFNNYINYLIV
jgi:hypothetical protein